MLHLALLFLNDEPHINQLVDLTLAYGAHWDVRDNQGQTIIDRVVQMSHPNHPWRMSALRLLAKYINQPLSLMCLAATAAVPMKTSLPYLRARLPDTLGPFLEMHAPRDDISPPVDKNTRKEMKRPFRFYSLDEWANGR
jgi:hypothetical protein